MCHSRDLNNRINNLHERVLRIVYQGRKSDFETLLTNDKSVTTHVRNLNYLVTEIYKVKNYVSPESIRDRKWELQLKEWYPFCFQKHENNIVWERDGIKLRSQNMVTIAKELKNSSSLEVFKNKLKEWKPTSCPCRFCKIYIQLVSII